MVKAWEQQQDKTQQPELNAIHAVMMAAAADRYKEDVKEEAEAMGLAEDEETVKMIAEKTQKMNRGLSLSAEEAAADQAESESGSSKEKIGFRDRKIIEYENRIRQYSAPDKVFRYFATYKLVDEKGNSEVLMTPQDFLRSISPGEKQPENLGPDAFISVALTDVHTIATKLDLDTESVFYQLGAGGLISFSDYIFLLTVLSTSRR